MHGRSHEARGHERTTPDMDGERDAEPRSRLLPQSDLSFADNVKMLIAAGGFKSTHHVCHIMRKRKLDVSRATVYRWVSGRCEPNTRIQFQTLVRICGGDMDAWDDYYQTVKEERRRRGVGRFTARRAGGFVVRFRRRHRRRAGRGATAAAPGRPGAGDRAGRDVRPPRRTRGPNRRTSSPRTAQDSRRCRRSGRDPDE